MNESLRTQGENHRKKILNIIGIIMLLAVLVYRGMQFYHWWTIGWDMKSYNPYMPMADFLAGHALLATIIVAGLPMVYYFSAIVNYIYDSVVVYGLVMWGYLSIQLAIVEIAVIIFEFIIIFYIIRAFWFQAIRQEGKKRMDGGYRA